jgi:hypothetical protein
MRFSPRKGMKHLVLPILAIFGFASETARAEAYFDLLTPMCIIGFENIPGLAECESSFPKMRAEIEKARDAWRKRNAKSLKRISALCQARLDRMFVDYAISADERGKITKGAKQFFDKQAVERAKNKADFAVKCHDMVRDIESDRPSLASDNIEQSFAETPVDMLFMRAVDSSFRKDAPAGIEANYSRDRGIDFAIVAGNVESLAIGKTHTLSPCLYQPVGTCISKLGRPPNEWRVMPSGEEHLVYYGKKLLYRGTPRNNHAVGLEWRIYVAKGGKIMDVYEVVQVLKRNKQSSEAYDICETYGERGTSLCPSVELIE